MEWALLLGQQAQQPLPALRFENAKKPNNDGQCCGVAVAKSGEDEKAHTPLYEVVCHPPDKQSATSADPPGLSQGRVRALAEWYSDETHRRYSENILDAAALNAELRVTLRKEVFPEFVEIEIERVMKVLFAK